MTGMVGGGIMKGMVGYLTEKGRNRFIMLLTFAEMVTTNPFDLSKKEIQRIKKYAKKRLMELIDESSSSKKEKVLEKNWSVFEDLAE